MQVVWKESKQTRIQKCRKIQKIGATLEWRQLCPKEKWENDLVKKSQVEVVDCSCKAFEENEKTSSPVLNYKKMWNKENPNIFHPKWVILEWRQFFQERSSGGKQNW